MFYDCKDENLINFISNPIDNIDILERKVSNNKILFTLSKISIFNNIIKSLYPKLFFEKELLLLLKSSKIEIQKLKETKETNENFCPKTILNLSKNYIDIINSFNIHPKVEDEYKFETLAIKIEYTLDRIKENHNLFSRNIEMEIIKKDVIVISYFLTEVFYYINIGVLDLIYNKKKYIVNITKDNVLRLKAYWLSEILEYNTKIKDKNELQNFYLEIKSKNKISRTLSNKITSYIFDKILYIQPKYFENNFLKTKEFIFFQQIVLFSSIIECFSINGQKIIHIKKLVKMSIFDNELIAFLIKNLNNEKEPFFFIKYKNNKFYRGTLEFKYGTRNFIGKMMNLKLDELKKQGLNSSDFGGIIGVAFEKQYVVNFLQTRLKEYRIETYGEFRPNTNAKIKGYDADLVLYDKKLEIYYFIQVKFNIYSQQTFLHERIKYYNGNKNKEGIDQLLVLKKNFNDESIKKKLKQHKLYNASLQNSHFILLHNMPYLNFYETNGIYLYEWNLFRNLLQNCHIDWYKNNLIKSEESNEFPKLYDIESLLNGYFNSNNAELREKYKWYEKCYFNLKKDDINFLCKDI